MHSLLITQPNVKMTSSCYAYSRIQKSKTSFPLVKMLLTGSLQFSFITYYVIRIAVIIFQRACADELMSTVTNLFIWLSK